MNTSRLNSIGRALVLAVLASVVIAIPIASQTQTSVPKWEAVSIKPCSGPASGAVSSSPDRLILNCQPLAFSIRTAYIRYAGGQFQPIWSVLQTTITSGPSWLISDRYTINAKAEGTPAKAIMQGPMLQAILEDRFKLKVHHEAKEIAIYELTVAKNGPKLMPFKQGSCSPVDPTKDEPPPPFDKQCRTRASRNGLNTIQEAQGISLDMFAQFFLTAWVGRPVANKTGIPGLFDFHIEYGPLNPPATTQSDVTPAPSIFTAVEEFGLKLEATKGRGDFLVIDSIERPTEN